MSHAFHHLTCVLTAFTLLLSGCRWERYGTSRERRKARMEKELYRELDFEVTNNTNQTLYITCFYYTKKKTVYRWRWYKSPIYELAPGELVIVDIETIPGERDVKDIYGYLAVFDNELDAQTAVYELLPDDKRIDLDRMVALRNKMVTISKRPYGYQGDLLDYNIVERAREKRRHPELDFVVENNTTAPIWLAPFIYQKRAGDPQWDFVKLPLVYVKNGQETLIDVDTIASGYDRGNIRGFLGVFEQDEKELAEKATYELLRQQSSIKLGVLRNVLKQKQKFVLEKRLYGLVVDREHKPEEWFYELKTKRLTRPISWYIKHG